MLFCTTVQAKIMGVAPEPILFFAYSLLLQANQAANLVYVPCRLSLSDPMFSTPVLGRLSSGESTLLSLLVVPCRTNPPSDPAAHPPEPDLLLPF